MKNAFQNYLYKKGGIGGAIAILTQTEVETFFTGNQSISRHEPITKDTIYEIGSLTKLFTTAILMDMVQKHELKLDDPIELYLPVDGKKITLRHLATHTSGLPLRPTNLKPQNRANPFADYTKEMLYAFLNDVILKDIPGTHCGYSDIGMALLAHILCLKTNQSYEQMIQARICKPLGLKNTSLNIPPEMQRHFAAGHHKNKEVSHWDFDILEGAGGLRSNLKDLTIFLLETMALNHQAQFLDGSYSDVVLGWYVSHKSIWHDGGTAGFRSFLGFNPTAHKGVVALSNSAIRGFCKFGIMALSAKC